MKKFYTSIIFIVALLLSSSVYAESTAPDAQEPYKYVQDLAGVLDDSQANALNDTLTQISDEIEFDIVVLTSTGVESDARMAYSDDFFDYNGYGYGDTKDGALLLINVDDAGVWTPGNSWVSGSGKGVGAVDEDAISDIGYSIKPMLEAGDYVGASEKYASMIKDDVNGYNTKGKLILIGVMLVVALIIAFMYTGKLKKDLISVEDATDANNYLVEGSLKLNRSYDHFLYATVTRVKKESKSSSHTSSSGNSHSGGGF